MSGLSSVILTGDGRSPIGDGLPRVLHSLGGLPLLGHAMDLVGTLGSQHVTVVADEAAKGEVEAYAAGRAAVVTQPSMTGSGDALLKAKERLHASQGDVLVLYGDRVFMRPESLKGVVEAAEKVGAACSLLSTVVERPDGNGRVIRDEKGNVIRTPRDCDVTDPKDRLVKEIVGGAYWFKREPLLAALDAIAGRDVPERFLTDVVWEIARGHRVTAYQTPYVIETRGLYSLRDLAEAEGRMQQRILERWMSEGVRITDPRTTSVGIKAVIGRGTIIYPNTIIDGPSVIGVNCQIGPFARIGAGANIPDGTSVGPFVEYGGAASEALGATL